MPRPGPRPYECVRRAWHSDRYMPIRGSLIQEIFRVVNEVHSSSTKKNKEWQEKLPVVVLKVEEIMYCKANSEAEYMDLKTLWDRSNDAINTIIRRDESTETGDLLQPCIEAALILGCAARKTSRSQRNCHPRCYLIPGTEDPNHPSPGSIVETNSGTNPQCISKFSNIIEPSTLSSTHPGSQLKNLVCQNVSVSANKFPFPTNHWHPSSYNQRLPLENCPGTSMCSVYPLYYGTCLESQNPNSVPSASGTVTMGAEQSLFSSNAAAAAAVRINQTEFKECLMDEQGMGCDLSLRLGSLSTPSPSVQNRQLGDVEDVGYGHSQELRKFNNTIPENGKEFTFFTRVNADNPREHVSVDTLTKKRKAVFPHPMDDQAYCWKPKLRCDDLTGRMKSTGI